MIIVKIMIIELTIIIGGKNNNKNGNNNNSTYSKNQKNK